MESSGVVFYGLCSLGAGQSQNDCRPRLLQSGKRGSISEFPRAVSDVLRKAPPVASEEMAEQKGVAFGAVVLNSSQACL